MRILEAGTGEPILLLRGFPRSSREYARHSLLLGRGARDCAGIPIEDIAHLVGHANTRTAEKVCRKNCPVLRRGAKAIDDLFNTHRAASEPPLCPLRQMRTKQSAEMRRYLLLAG
jgi:hypothetical protein